MQSREICVVPGSTWDAGQERSPMKMWQMAFGFGVSLRRGWEQGPTRLRSRAGTALSRDYSSAGDEEDIK